MGMEFRLEFRVRHAKLEIKFHFLLFCPFWYMCVPPFILQGIDLRFTYKRSKMKLNKLLMETTNGAMENWEIK